jgi:hypothetical protein
MRVHMATSDFTGLTLVTFSHTFMPSGKTPPAKELCEFVTGMVVSSSHEKLSPIELRLHITSPWPWWRAAFLGGT